MEVFRRRSSVVIVATVAIVVLGVAAVMLWDDGSGGGEDDGDLLAQAQATLTARAQMPTSAAASPVTTEVAAVEPRPTFSGVCEVSEPHEQPAPSTTATDGLNDWYGDGYLWMAPVPPAPVGQQVSSGEQSAATANPWFAGSPMQIVWAGSTEPVAITGIQLDGEATLEVVASKLRSLDVYEMTVLMPEPGCWQIIGTVGETSLSVTVEVAPISERPDYVVAQEARETNLPWTVPSTCQTVPWVVDARAARRAAQWWTDSGDLALGDADGVLFEGENAVTWVTGVFSQRGYDFTIAAERADSTNEQFEFSLHTQQPIFEGRLEFTSPGCWDLHVEHPTDVGPSSTTLTVYVYPASCQPLSDGGVPDMCIEPA